MMSHHQPPIPSHAFLSPVQTPDTIKNTHHLGSTRSEHRSGGGGGGRLRRRVNGAEFEVVSDLACVCFAFQGLRF